MNLNKALLEIKEDHEKASTRKTLRQQQTFQQTLDSPMAHSYYIVEEDTFPKAENIFDAGEANDIVKTMNRVKADEKEWLKALIEADQEIDQDNMMTTKKLFMTELDK